MDHRSENVQSRCTRMAQCAVAGAVNGPVSLFVAVLATRQKFHTAETLPLGSRPDQRVLHKNSLRTASAGLKTTKVVKVVKAIAIMSGTTLLGTARCVAT